MLFQIRIFKIVRYKYFELSIRCIRLIDSSSRFDSILNSLDSEVHGHANPLEHSILAKQNMPRKVDERPESWSVNPVDSPLRQSRQLLPHVSGHPEHAFPRDHDERVVHRDDTLGAALLERARLGGRGGGV